MREYDQPEADADEQSIEDAQALTDAMVEDELDNPRHEWETIWDDGVGQICQFCMICNDYRIIQYDPEESGR